jgi:hypothetical protein
MGAQAGRHLRNFRLLRRDQRLQGSRIIRHIYKRLGHATS